MENEKTKKKRDPRAIYVMKTENKDRKIRRKEETVTGRRKMKRKNMY